MNTYDQTVETIKKLHDIITLINDLDLKSLTASHKALPLEQGKDTRHKLYLEEGTYARKLLSTISSKDKDKKTIWIDNVSFQCVLKLIDEFQVHNEKLEAKKETV